MGAHHRLPLAILTVACGANVINVDPTAPTVREAKHTLAKLSSDVDVIRSSVDELQLSHARRQKLEALSEALASARDAADDYLDVGRPSTPLVGNPVPDATGESRPPTPLVENPVPRR